MLKSRAHCPYKHCPDENQLVALTEGTLRAEQVQQLEHILDRCSHCAELMALLARELHPGDSEDNALPLDALPTDFDLSEQPPVRIGHYQVRRLLGSGGMGVIYEAFDEIHHRTVALKLLRPDVLEPSRQEAHRARMLREARLLTSLHHRNIPDIYEVGTWDQKIFLAIQFVPGANMRQWLERQNPGWREIIDLYLQAGEGIVAAHQANIIHRDIKPDNILVARTGEVYITDFGLARLASSTYHSISMADAMSAVHDNLSLTGTGDILGTPAYMAPEQYMGRGVSKRSDQFSFCVSLYEALYGMRPFAGQTMDELIQAAQNGAVFKPRFSEVPNDVLRVLTRGMHPVPRERYSSMRELLDTLYQAAHRTSSATPTLRIGAIAAATLFILGAILVLFYYGGGSLRWRKIPSTSPKLSQIPDRKTPGKTRSISAVHTQPQQSRQFLPNTILKEHIGTLTSKEALRLQDRLRGRLRKQRWKSRRKRRKTSYRRKRRWKSRRKRKLPRTHPKRRRQRKFRKKRSQR